MGNKIYFRGFFFLLSFNILLFAISAQSENSTLPRSDNEITFIKIKNITIKNKNNFPKSLNRKLLNLLSKNKIENLLNRRYSFLLSGIYHSLQSVMEFPPEVEIIITRNNPYAGTSSPAILYTTIILHTQFASHTLKVLKSKISVDERSYRAILPGITGEIAYMLAKLNKFKTNTKTLPPVLESYITKTQLHNIFETFKRYTRSNGSPKFTSDHATDEIEIYSFSPYTQDKIDNESKTQGITLLTNMGFISLDSALNLNKITMRDLAFQESHKETNREFDTVFTDRFNNLYLFSNYNGKLKRINFDRNTSSEKIIKFSPNSTLLKWGNNTFLLIKEPPNPTITIYSINQSTEKLKSTLSIPLYTNFFSVVSIKQSLLPQTSFLYIFDTLERRIRIIDSTGKEIDSIKPIYNPQVIPMPNNMKIFQDGSFILSGSGTIMKFDQFGLPLWGIESYTINYPTAFPPFTKICINEERESLYILDNQTNTILKYSYNQEKISKIKNPSGIHLNLKPIKIANLLEKLAAEKEQELIYPVAREYYNYAISIYRKLRLQYPLETGYSSHLLQLVKKRNRIVNALIKRNILDIRVKNIRLTKVQVDKPQTIKPHGTLILEIKNRKDLPLTNIKIKINIPYLLTTPIGIKLPEIKIDRLEGNQGKTLTIPLKIKRDLYRLLSDKLLTANRLERENWDTYIKTNYTFKKASIESLFHLLISLPPISSKN